MPPKPGMSGGKIALIVLGVLVGFLVVAGGGCLVCTAVIARKLPDTLDAATNSPVAIELKTALQKDGIPVEGVMCPPTVATDHFECIVLPGAYGDPAKLTVTKLPGGLHYELQDGFVVLEGPKLVAAFGAEHPGVTVPCFTGKILKRVPSSFMCNVPGGGTVTTHVVDRTAHVRFDYAPAH